MIPQNDTLHETDQPNNREKILDKKNSHFGPKHDVFGLKLAFLLSLTIYIKVDGHMIAQIEALDMTKKLCYPKKKFWVTKK